MQDELQLSSPFAPDFGSLRRWAGTTNPDWRKGRLRSGHPVWSGWDRHIGFLAPRQHRQFLLERYEGKRITVKTHNEQ